MPPTRALPTFLFLMLLSAAHVACAKSETRSASTSSPPAAAAVAAVQAPSLPAEERAMRITVEMSLVVPHRDAAVNGLRAALADLGGYVSNGAVTGPDATGAASFEVKVPAARVGAFRAAIRAMGDIRTDTEKAEDVTEARADVQARLGNARAEEGRMLAVLADKTGNLADVVAVEKELSRVRESIERLEAEERVLLGQIAMATVKVQLETSFVASDPGAGSRLARAAKDGGETAWAFVVGLGVFLLGAGPTLLILAALAYVSFLGVRGLVRLQRARVVDVPDRR
jgi:hypothetical protein